MRLNNVPLRSVIASRSNRVHNLASSPHEPSCRPTFSRTSFHPSDPRLSLHINELRGRRDLLVPVAFEKGVLILARALCTLTSKRNGTLESDDLHL